MVLKWLGPSVTDHFQIVFEKRQIENHAFAYHH